MLIADYDVWQVWWPVTGKHIVMVAVFPVKTAVVIAILIR